MQQLIDKVGRTRSRLLTRMPQQSICAEIGVWEGDYSAEILDAVNPTSLVLIDPWQFMPQHPESIYGGAEADGQDYMDRIHQNVTERFSGDPRVTILRETSTDAASRFEDGHFDWIYLDADHSYEAAKADLAAWAPKIRPGGYLAGDDYVDGGWWNGGVKQAVNESGLDLVWQRGSQFVLAV